MINDVTSAQAGNKIQTNATLGGIAPKNAGAARDEGGRRDPCPGAAGIDPALDPYRQIGTQTAATTISFSANCRRPVSIVAPKTVVACCGS
jgi:hypothetical protein